MKRAYLRLHLWLKAGCERLTIRQRRIILITVCSIYFISCIGLIIPMFILKENRKNGTDRNNQTRRAGTDRYTDTERQFVSDRKI